MGSDASFPVEESAFAGSESLYGQGGWGAAAPAAKGKASYLAQDTPFRANPALGQVGEGSAWRSHLWNIGEGLKSPGGVKDTFANKDLTTAAKVTRMVSQLAAGQSPVLGGVGQGLGVYAKMSGWLDELSTRNKQIQDANRRRSAGTKVEQPPAPFDPLAMGGPGGQGIAALASYIVEA